MREFAGRVLKLFLKFQETETGSICLFLGLFEKVVLVRMVSAAQIVGFYSTHA